jgi:2-methylfumaryl-CoA isomerase
MAALGQSLGRDLTRQGERFEAREEIAGQIAPWIKAHPLTEVARIFDDCGVCWGPYQSFRELVESDPLCSPANPLMSLLDQPGIGSYLAPGSPLAFGAFPRVPARPAPALGGDTEAVLGDVLGMDSGEIGRLFDSGVVAGPDTIPT